MTSVLTIGSFDLLHPGHLELLRWCREHADRVTVAVNSDAFVERYKGRPPTQPFAHRAEILEALRYVDAVCENTGDEAAHVVIDWVGPTFLAIGDDWLDPGHDERRYLAQLGITARWLEERNLWVAYVPRTRGVSTSQLRAATWACSNCGAPANRHCGVHLVPCCPGKCPGPTLVAAT